MCARVLFFGRVLFVALTLRTSFPSPYAPSQDDGQGLICCDQCEDWQHLPCHMHADELAGRPPQPYSDESFKWICGHCRGTCHRRPRPPKPAPGAPPTIAYARVDPSASHKRKGSHSSGSVAAKKVKVGHARGLGGASV